MKKYFFYILGITYLAFQGSQSAIAIGEKRGYYPEDLVQNVPPVLKSPKPTYPVNSPRSQIPFLEDFPPAFSLSDSSSLGYLPINQEDLQALQELRSATMKKQPPLQELRSATMEKQPPLEAGVRIYKP